MTHTTECPEVFYDHNVSEQALYFCDLEADHAGAHYDEAIKAWW